MKKKKEKRKGKCGCLCDGRGKSSQLRAKDDNFGRLPNGTPPSI